jgi:hypothetical protein
MNDGEVCLFGIIQKLGWLDKLLNEGFAFCVVLRCPDEVAEH